MRRLHAGSVGILGQDAGAARQVSEWSEVVAVVPVDAVRYPVSGIPPFEPCPMCSKRRK
jgi:hypothetical protein